MKINFNKKKVSIISLSISIGYFILTAINISVFSKKDETQKVDSAIVLGAAVWNNEPSPVFKERINHSVFLYKNRYINSIIFTGGIADYPNRMLQKIMPLNLEFYQRIFILKKSLKSLKKI